MKYWKGHFIHDIDNDNDNKPYQCNATFVISSAYLTKAYLQLHSES